VSVLEISGGAYDYVQRCLSYTGQRQ